jgi:DNA-binding Lrp family transcriptional regulator
VIRCFLIYDFECVKEVYDVFGRYDFVVKVKTKTLEELGNVVMIVLGALREC